jgi:hypothetical protein
MRRKGPSVKKRDGAPFSSASVAHIHLYLLRGLERQIVCSLDPLMRKKGQLRINVATRPQQSSILDLSSRERVGLRKRPELRSQALRHCCTPKQNPLQSQ